MRGRVGAIEVVVVFVVTFALVLIFGLATLPDETPDHCPAFAAETLPNGALVVYRDCGDHIVTEYPWRDE